MVALNLALQMAILICAGVLIMKVKLVGEDFPTNLSKFILNVSLPCLIVKSLNVSFSLSELWKFGSIILLALGVMALLFLLGTGAFFLLKKGSTGRIVRFGTIYPNFSFVGIPVVEALCGATGVLYFTIFTIPVRLIYYSSAKPLLGAKKEGPKNPLRLRILHFFSPPIVAVILGLILYFFSITLPEPLTKAISAVSSTASPLGMLLCGMTLSKLELKNFFRHPKIFFLPLLRNLAAPALVLLLLCVLPLNLDPLVCRVVVLYSALPCAAMLTTFAVVYDPSPQARIESSVGVFSSTLLSVVTLPIFAALLDRFL